MKRRHALALLAAAIPLPARAATSRIGLLNFDNPEPLGGLLRKSLRDLGYSDGTLQIEFRSAKGDPAALSALAAELVRAKLELIVAYPTPAVFALKQATRDIPIIMLGAGDPAATAWSRAWLGPAATSPAPRRPPRRWAPRPSA